ncbi:unnamed protein product [Acanthoscelides obtectus]|uniref:Uncharacterized protein n=1 Tax=Acanthoscelides obtectus TaxID=200917 RepID=A0A9P0P9M6_ACAOB|nr:unnamed protein product [Acanthoscelides obtectus]CAK1647582.1 hypothetical protein AOBTE_LOCUS15280 [Acanthoscelides obtectus]
MKTARNLYKTINKYQTRQPSYSLLSLYKSIASQYPTFRKSAIQTLGQSGKSVLQLNLRNYTRLLYIYA